MLHYSNVKPGSRTQGTSVFRDGGDTKLNILLVVHIMAWHQYLYCWVQVLVPRHKCSCSRLAPLSLEVMGTPNSTLGSESFISWIIGVRTRACTQGFASPLPESVFEQQIGVEHLHHLWLSPPLKLYSFSCETIICKSLPPTKIFGQKAKSNH